MKGYALVKKLKKKEGTVIGEPAMLQQSAMQCNAAMRPRWKSLRAVCHSSPLMAGLSLCSEGAGSVCLSSAMGVMLLGTVVHMPAWQAANLLHLRREFQ